MNQIIPIFASHYSIGRSILTCEAKRKSKENGPKSIIDLCLKYNIQNVFLSDTHFAGQLDAWKNCKEANLNLRFGIKFIVCDDYSQKNEESLRNQHKVYIWALNSKGLKDLQKLYTISWQNMYYRNRLDYNIIQKYWTENLSLWHPFFDSFLHKNTLTFSTIVPNWGTIVPIFCVENLHNDLPFCSLIKNAIGRYCQANNYDVIQTHSIYYANRESFKSYLVARCINERSSLNHPDLEMMASNSFGLDIYLKSQNVRIK
ncbi:MAG: PHP domain-containing protein [Nanoarchaeota archaeon]